MPKKRKSLECNIRICTTLLMKITQIQKQNINPKPKDSLPLAKGMIDRPYRRYEYIQNCIKYNYIISHFAKAIKLLIYLVYYNTLIIKGNY